MVWIGTADNSRLTRFVSVLVVENGDVEIERRI